MKPTNCLKKSDRPSESEMKWGGRLNLVSTGLGWVEGGWCIVLLIVPLVNEIPPPPFEIFDAWPMPHAVFGWLRCCDVSR